MSTATQSNMEEPQGQNRAYKSLTALLEHSSTGRRGSHPSYPVPVKLHKYLCEQTAKEKHNAQLEFSTLSY